MEVGMEAHICNKEKEIATLQADVKTLYRRMSAQEANTAHINKLVTNIAVLADNMKGLKGDITEIKDDVRELKNIPIKESRETRRVITNTMITFIVTTILNWIFFKSMGG